MHILSNFAHISSIQSPPMPIRLILLFLLLSPSWLAACSLPVFRYALDRWEPDDFTLEVPEAGADGIVRFEASWEPANLHVESDIEFSSLRLVEAEQYQRESHEIDPVSEAELSVLTDSPARREIARLICEGDAAVFLVVGDPESEIFSTTLETLQSRLRELEEVLELPDIDPTDPANDLGPGPALAIRFTVVGVDAADPQERIFLKQLRWGLENPEAEVPFLSVIYGRGRALASVSLDGASMDDVRSFTGEVGAFLTGICSCQVKSLNPGWDLLFPGGWDEMLERVQETGSVRAAEEAATPSGMPSSSPPPGVQDLADEKPRSKSSPMLWTFSLLAAGVIVIGGWLLFRKR